MHDGIWQPRTRGGTPCMLPNERTPHARRVEIECLQTLVDPALVGDRTASTPAQAGRRLAAQREQAEGRDVPNAREQLGAGTYMLQADSRRQGRRFHVNSLVETHATPTHKHNNNYVFYPSTSRLSGQYNVTITPYLSRDTTYCYRHCKGILHFLLLSYHLSPRPMPNRITSAS